jgi:hypothetical protein
MTKRVVVVAGLLLGCVREEVPEQYRSFFALSLDQQQDSLLNYSFEDQLEIYMIGVTHFGPARTYLARPLAANGARILPVILRGLRAAEGPHEAFRLLAVLEEMGCSYYDLRQDPAVIAQLDSVLAGLPQDYWTDRAHEALRVIRREDQCTISESDVRERMRRLRNGDSAPRG